MRDKPKQRYTRLTAPQVARIKADLRAGKSQRAVVRDEQVSFMVVNAIAKGVSWEWVQPEGRADVAE